MPELYSKPILGIRSLDHLSKRLCIPLAEIESVSSHVNSQYTSWNQPKKKGGFRKITAPMPPLKRIQSAIHQLLSEVEIPDVAHGGIKCRSNLTNAKCHAGQNHIFNLDFEKFYPNISHYRVYHLFRHELDCSPDVARLLTRLCTLDGGVPQGAPMSMDIANLVCRGLDKRLEALAQDFHLKFTRYVDDSTFSGRFIPRSFILKAKEIIVSMGFKLNSTKEQLCGRHQSQIVTGLCVNRSKVSVPRKMKRGWRVEEHVANKYGVDGAEAQIKGRKAYIRYVQQSE